MGNTCFTPSRQPTAPETVSKVVQQLLATETVAGELKQTSDASFTIILIRVAQHLHDAIVLKHDDVWLEHSDTNFLIVSKFSADLNLWVKANHGKELVCLSMCEVPIIRTDGQVEHRYYHRFRIRDHHGSAAGSSSAHVNSAAVFCS